MRVVSRFSVWNPATRDDSSGISRKISSAKWGVLRQWSSTAAIRQNSPVRASTNSQEPVAAMSLLAASAPNSSVCRLLTIQVADPAGLVSISLIGTSDQGVPVLTSMV